MTFFDENLKLLAARDPALAQMLKVKGSSVGGVHFDSNFTSEAKEWLGNLESSGVEVLCIYGVGNGNSYDLLREWLHSKIGRYLVFLEDDLRVLYALLETELGKAILSDSRVHLRYVEDYDKEVISLVGTFARATIGFAALKSYEHNKKQSALFLQQAIRLHTSSCGTIYQENFERDGNYNRREIVHNIYTNVSKLQQSSHLTKLSKAFKGIPAIICGAGPSLDKNYHVLQRLSNSALIIAGGSAINALEVRDIMPHLGVYVDPYSTLFARFSLANVFEIPIVYTSRTDHNTVSNIHGISLFSRGCSGYPVAELLERSAGMSEMEYEDEGINVVNWSVVLAQYLGCSPIVLVGVDRAMMDGCYYSAGVVSDSTAKILDVEGMYKIKDIHGEEVFTLEKWVTETTWLGQYVANNTDVKIINSTEGGIGVPGVDNIRLADLEWDREFDITNMLYALSRQATEDIDENGVVNEIKRLNSGLRKIKLHCREIESKLSSMLRRVEQGYDVDVNKSLTKVKAINDKIKGFPVYDTIFAYAMPICDSFLQRRCIEIQGDNLLSNQQKVIQILKSYLTYNEHLEFLTSRHLKASSLK